MNITRIAQPGRLRLIIAAVIVAIAGLVIPLSQIASARTAEAAAAAAASCVRSGERLLADRVSADATRHADRTICTESTIQQQTGLRGRGVVWSVIVS